MLQPGGLGTGSAATKSNPSSCTESGGPLISISLMLYNSRSNLFESEVDNKRFIFAFIALLIITLACSIFVGGPAYPDSPIRFP